MFPFPQTGSGRWVGSSLSSPHNHFFYSGFLSPCPLTLLLLFLFKQGEKKRVLKFQRNMAEVRRTEATTMKHEHKVSLEDSELRRPFDSPSYNNGGNRASGDSTPQRPAVVSSDAPKRAARLNGAGFRSADHSPLHPHYQAKISNKASVVSSPSWERKGSSEGTHGLAPSTPGRSRLRSVPRSSETSDRGASVPKFGEWDETDPSSADGYSMIFNKVKEERHGSGGNASGTATDAQRSSGQKHYRGNNSKGCCCFPWGGN